MWLLYFNSNILSFIMNYVINYRKKLVINNLVNSFPEKNKKEINQIIKKYYIHLSDLILETIKGYSMSSKEMKKRFGVKNKELVMQQFANNENVIFVGGHYGNWEWGAQATPLYLKHESVILFKPLKNRRINDYVKKVRERNGSHLVSIATTGLGFVKHEKPYSVIMVADQNPTGRKNFFWVNFLNQPTPCLHGVELYAKKYNTTVNFFCINRIKRGYYEISLELITNQPQKMPKGEITKIFMQKLENSINQQPFFWLWSHNRWKHKFNPETEKII